MDVKMLPRMIDLSCVKANSSFEEMVQMVDMAKKYNFICCFSYISVICSCNYRIC